MVIRTKIKGQGFTLVELLIVVAIIAILSTLVIVQLTSAQLKTRDTKRLSDTKAMESALALYWNDNAEYPAPADWPGLYAEIGTYLSALPMPPGNPAGEVYSYLVRTSDDPATLEIDEELNQFYISASDIEDENHQALTQDTDDVVGGTGWDLTTSLPGTITVVDTKLDCNDPAYCLVGNATN